MTTGTIAVSGYSGVVNSLLQMSQSIETLSIASVLFLALVVTWWYVVRNLWRKIEEKDAQITSLTDTLAKIVDVIEHGDISTQGVVYEEAKRIIEKINAAHTAISSLDSFMKGKDSAEKGRRK